MRKATETPLPSPAEIKRELPLGKDTEIGIQKQRRQIEKILSGEDPRFLMIVGPCSIHNPQEALDYAKKLAALAEAVSDTLLVLMRVYCEKPRTALGWQGLLFDPTLDGEGNIPQGIRTTRKLMLQLSDLGIGIATEFLDPLASYYYSDLISWGCIGARTTSSQIHRQIASGLPMPVGFKNATDGQFIDAINGMKAASFPQSHIGLASSGTASHFQTPGNPHTHLVLRGGVDAPNYDDFCLQKASDLLRSHNLPCRLLVDCSHDNSGKDPARQPEVLDHILASAKHYPIAGALLESNILAGKQPHMGEATKLRYGVSITDGCIDWETTERLLLKTHKSLQGNYSLISSF